MVTIGTDFGIRIESISYISISYISIFCIFRSLPFTTGADETYISFVGF